MNALRGVLAALLLTAPAAAPLAWGQEDGFGFDAPLGVGLAREMNFLDGFRQIDDVVTIVRSPRLVYSKPRPRSSLDLRYQAEGEYFRDHPHLDTWNHTADAVWSYDLSRTATLTVRDSFLSTEDPSRSLGNSLFLLPRSRYDENTFMVSTEHRSSPFTTFTLRYDNTVTLLDLPQPMRPGVFDQMGQSASIGVAHRLEARHEVGLQYTFFTLHLLGDEGPLVETPAGTEFGTTDAAHEVVGSYNYSRGTDLEINLSGGVVVSSSASYTASAQIRKRFGLFWLDAGYTRTLTSTAGTPTSPGLGRAGGAGALLGNVLFETATAGISGSWNRFGVDLRVTGSQAESARRVNPLNFFQVRRFNDIRSGIVRGRADYDLSSRFTVFTSYDYYGQNENELSLQALGRSRHAAGIEFHITPEARQPRLSRAAGPAEAP